MAWLSGYLYRKPITLTGGSSGAQTYYQLKLAAAFVTDHMQSDFDDLRFTDADGNLIDAWLEVKTDSTSADVWVEFPSTPANGETQTYYMYYGKADAVNYWDGAAAFPELFDDFLGTSLDTGKWTATGSGISVADSILSIDATVNWGHRIVSISTVPNNRIIETRATMNDGATNAIELMLGYGDWGTDTVTWGIGAEYQSSDAQQWQARYNTYTEEPGTGLSIVGMTYNTYDILSMAILPSEAYFYKNRVQFEHSTVNSLNDKKITIANTDQTAKVDWILARKYAANPPTYGFGSEESAITILDFERAGMRGAFRGIMRGVV